MRRGSFRIAAAVALAVTGTATGMQAQVTFEGPPRFEFGLYAGGAYSGDWFSTSLQPVGLPADPAFANASGSGPGWTGAFGGSATWFFVKDFGVRLHYGYMPSEIPTVFDADLNDALALNIHMYDLNLVYRPWAERGDGLLADTYLFLGGGGLTSDVASSGLRDDLDVEEGCEARLRTVGACLPLEGEEGTVGQAVFGAGFNLFAIESMGVYTEFAAHAYDSPIHEGLPTVQPLTAGTSIPVAGDEWAITPRLSLGVTFGFGDYDPPPPPRMIAPPPPRREPPPPPPPPANRPISVCVVESGGVAMVDALFNPTTRDTTVSGQRFADRYPSSAPNYAAGASWFLASDSARFDNTDYVKFGLARVIEPAQLTRAGDIDGTTVFAPAGAVPPYPVLYVPVRPGCQFQPYERRQALSPRG